MEVLGDEVATRYLHARATSKPPPRQSPLMAATNGMGALLNLSKRAWPARESYRKRR